MTITFKKGDMFLEPVEAVVNTVNCVGVMGKGVALEFKKRWPDNFKAYKKLCDAKQLVPGQMFVFENPKLFASSEPRYLINFPTKAHWRSKSKISYVEDGLDALAKDLVEFGISSVAIPPLGCGNGGLEWSEVRPLIEEKLGALSGVQIVVFPPFDEVETPEYVHSGFPMTFERATLLKALGDLGRYFDDSLDRITMQKIAYFLQALGVDFKLEFSRNLHGPYSEALRKAFVALEQNGMISGFVTGDRRSRVTPSGYAVADEFLKSSDRSSDDIIQRLDRLVQGFESPYGLELLASVHWLAKHELHYPVEKIIEAMKLWTEDKRNRFSEEVIRVAYSRLEEDMLLG
jgi:O-acetyl-ADP-ribose deacetylase (regulator of RNase III)